MEQLANNGSYASIDDLDEARKLAVEDLRVDYKKSVATAWGSHRRGNDNRVASVSQRISGGIFP